MARQRSAMRILGSCFQPAIGPSVGWPANDAVILFTDSFASEVLACLSSPAAFRPLWPKMVIPGATTQTTDSGFFSFVWPAGIPEGPYTIFMAVLRPGALTGATVGASAFIGLTATTVTFGP